MKSKLKILHPRNASAWIIIQRNPTLRIIIHADISHGFYIHHTGL